MTLPYELLQYAENFYRRFPEEFLALGAPGMEEIYDLRPNSTSTRRIQETPQEKTVEITIRRWQGPSTFMGGYNGRGDLTYNGYNGMHNSMPHSAGYPQAPSYGPSPSPAHLSAIGVMQQQAAGLSASSTAAGHFGHPMYNAYSGMPPAHGMPPSAGVPPYGYPGMPPAAEPPSSGPPAAPPHWQVELASHLVRLEGALSSLKPQIESALLNNPPQKKQVPLRIPVTTAGSSDDTSVMCANGSTPIAPLKSAANSLASRRAVLNLAIDTAPKAQAAPRAKSTEPAAQPAPVAQNAAKQSGMRPPPVVVVPVASSPQNGPKLPTSPQNDKAKRQVSSEVDGKTDDQVKSRPSVIINPVRVAPAIQDPQSPRSPGRFSAWK